MDSVSVNTNSTNSFSSFDWGATPTGGSQSISTWDNPSSWQIGSDQSFDTFSWNDGDSFVNSFDPWHNPGSALDAFDIEPTILLFDEPMQLPGIFPGPGLIDLFPSPNDPIWATPPGAGIDLPSPGDPFPWPGIPTPMPTPPEFGFPSPTDPFPWPGDPMPIPRLPIFEFPGGVDPFPSPWKPAPIPDTMPVDPFPEPDFTVLPGFGGPIRVPTDHGWKGTLTASGGVAEASGEATPAFDPADFGKRVVEGGAKSFQNAQSAVLREAANRATGSADAFTKESRVIGELFERLAADPNVSDDTVRAVRDSFFEARAYSQQANAIAESARDAAGRSEFYGTLAGGTVDALAGAERLLDAERRIRETKDPREAYRIMWETAIRFPLDVLLAAPNKLGLAGNLGAGYAADGASKQIGDSIADATFDTVNRWAHQVAEWEYWPERLKPAYPLN